MRKITSLFLVFSIIILYGNLYAKERKGADLVILKMDNRQVKGELIAVKKNSLLLKDSQSGADVTVEVSDIRDITIVKKSKALLGADLPPIIVPPPELESQVQKPLGLVVCTPKNYEAGTDYIPFSSSQ